MARKKSSISRVSEPFSDQRFDIVAAFTEAPDRECGTVERERRNDRVDTRAVTQARIDHRRRFIDPAPDLRDDAVDDQHQMLIILEGHVGAMKLAELFDVHLVEWPLTRMSVMSSSCSSGSSGPSPEQLVFDFADQPRAIDLGEKPAVVVECVVDRGGHLARNHRRLERVQLGDVQHFEEPIVHANFESA
jgi:hypothetical protein